MTPDTRSATLSDLAAAIIEQAYRYPRHRGELEDATGRCEEENPLCGDVVIIQVRIAEERIAAARFQGRGCAISQAAAELLLARVEGQPVSAIATLGKDDVLDELGLPQIVPARLKCALLPLEALKQAVRP